MFLESYKKALMVLAKKPFVLWGLSLMSGLLSILTNIFFGLIPALGLAIGFLISCGMAKVYLDGLKGKEVYSDQLFEAFGKNCFRVAGGMAWQSLWVLIWALIPIVGPIIAIVKSYSYRFVPYILVTCPEVKATEALRISMKQTEGIKGQMFLADICFIGGVLVASLVLSLFSLIPVLGILFALVLAILFILLLAFSNIFAGLYQAYFYDMKNPEIKEETIEIVPAKEVVKPEETSTEETVSAE